MIADKSQDSTVDIVKAAIVCQNYIHYQIKRGKKNIQKKNKIKI